jgi:hypothetical protein
VAEQTSSEATEPGDDDALRARPGGPVHIELEASRRRPALWTVGGILGGAFLVSKFGTVGVWVGIVLMVVGAFRAWELVQSFLHPPGTISVTEDTVSLPRGLRMPKPLTLAPNEVTAAYFLRRSVPWNRAAPVLIIEIGPRALAFPRDWFASEADQRRVIHALLRGLASEPNPHATAPGGASGNPEDKLAIQRSTWAHRIGGTVLLGIGIAGTAISHSQGSDGGDPYAIYVAPIAAGIILLWRGIAR